jgi:hypothetical protein
VSCRQKPTRSEIDSVFWLNNSNALLDACAESIDLRDVGFYRRLESGDFELVSFCNENAQDFLSIYKDDLEKILKDYAIE